MRIILGIAALAAVLLASPALAQQGTDGLTGTRVRVTAPNFFPVPIRGTVTSYNQYGLTVAREDTTADSIVSVTVPLRAVTRLDRFAGGSAGATAWYRGRLGAFIGAGLGLIAGPLSAKATGRGVGESALLGGAAGLVSGFTLGAIIGAASPHERWKWAMQPWGYDPSLRPAPPPPPPPPPPMPPVEQTPPPPPVDATIPPPPVDVPTPPVSEPLPPPATTTVPPPLPATTPS
jgi:hypothetical protein